jgi:phosphoglycerate kinase
LLENLRFEPGEEANDPGFADGLAALAQAYVDDAFGAAHRAHASVVGVPARLPAAAGLLLVDEVAKLSRLLDDPQQPFVAVLGGAKVSDKLGVIGNLLERVQAMCIGGAMANTLLAARGVDVGRSSVESDRLDEVREARAGDFVFIPPQLVHWEENASDTEPVEMVVARSTQEAIVINIDDHPYAPAHAR